MKKIRSNKVINIYLDACCLNRPFDDQTQDRIRMEAESVIILLKYSVSGKIRLIGSDVLKLEIGKTPDPVRRSQLLSLSVYISKFYKLNDDIIKLAADLQKSGFSTFDSFHIAIAEKSKIDIFVTTDDKIHKLYRRKPGLLNIRIENPVDVIRELLL